LNEFVFTIVFQWYSKINLYFSHVPLFLVRTKCDLRTNGIKYVFFETLAALKTKKETDPGVDLANSMTPLQGVAAVLSRLGSSGPLLKQIVVNVRECIANPAAFPDMKESDALQIDSYLPFSLFGTTPTTAVNKLAIEDDLAVEKTQSDTSICSITPPAFCLTIKSASNESHISSEEMDEEKLLLEKEC
uniref:SCY1-like protein 2 n=1 Tax=Nippostrongylus brasiliensis TaxID=27835 RepID=A0A0N4YZG8_NIPBR